MDRGGDGDVVRLVIVRAVPKVPRTWGARVDAAYADETPSAGVVPSSASGATARSGCACARRGP